MSHAKQFRIGRQEKNYPDLETIITISDVYRISLDTLLKGDTFIVKEIKKGIHLAIIKRGLVFLGLLSIAICLVVNLALSRQLTWSLIPLISLIALGLVWLTFEQAKTYKCGKASLCLSVLVVPYLWLLDIILVNSSYIQRSIFSLALPVSLLWLALFWLTGIVQLRMGWNWCYSLSLLCLLAIGGNYLTNVLIGQNHEWLSLAITTLSTGSAALVFFFLGNFFTQQTRHK